LTAAAGWAGAGFCADEIVETTDAATSATTNGERRVTWCTL
jgi:hypothetical protein